MSEDESRLLTQKELEEAILPYEFNDTTGYFATKAELLKKAQDAKTDKLAREDERKKIAVWLDGWCVKSLHSEDMYSTVDVPRRDCPDCYDELLTQLREGKPLEGG